MKEEPAYTSATEEEMTIAHAIFYAGRKFGSQKLRKLNNKDLSDKERESEFKKVYGLASRHVTGIGYDELSPAIRSEISHLHGLGSDFRFRKPPDTVGPSRWSEIQEEMKGEKVAELVSFWEEDFACNQSLRSALHPEDEQVLLEDLPRFLAEQKSTPYRRSKKHR